MNLLQWMIASIKEEFRLQKEYYASLPDNPEPVDEEDIESESAQPDLDELNAVTPVFHINYHAPSRSSYNANFKVAGTSHYKENFISIGRENRDWLQDKRLAKGRKAGDVVYQYSFASLPCRIVKEPTNPYDKNALRVDVANTKVGYIARDDQSRIQRYLKNKKTRWYATIEWGPSKKVIGTGVFSRGCVFLDYDFSMNLFAE